MVVPYGIVQCISDYFCCCHGFISGGVCLRCHCDARRGAVGLDLGTRERTFPKGVHGREHCTVNCFLKYSFGYDSAALLHDTRSNNIQRQNVTAAIRWGVF